MRRWNLLAMLGATLLPMAPALAGNSAPPPLVARAVADASRPADDAKQDAVRKPAETLAFAGVRPGMIVGEFYPGGGYFTRMLSVAVGSKGHVYGIENDRWMTSLGGYKDFFSSGHYANTSIEAAPFGSVKFPRPLDLAWITQNYHDLKIARYGVVDTAAFNRAVFAALKPGGVFLVLDHEAPPGTDVAGIEKLHRIEKAQVIREVTAAGFRLAGEGMFLRNAADDHSLPVFDPKVRFHTDQYALKFVKPR